MERRLLLVVFPMHDGGQYHVNRGIYQKRSAKLQHAVERDS